MHPLLELICYGVGTICFLLAVFRPKTNPATLDYLAIGVFLYSLPFLAEKLALLV